MYSLQDETKLLLEKNEQLVEGYGAKKTVVRRSDGRLCSEGVKQSCFSFC